MTPDIVFECFVENGSLNNGAVNRFRTLVVMGVLIIISFLSGVLPVAAEPLPTIGPAPDFKLVNQDGNRFSLEQLRGRVAVVTFIFTSCSDTCPLLTAKLLSIQRGLGPDTPEVFFVAISVDPLHDSPAVLKKYAQAYSAPLDRFAFLTGDFDEISQVVRSYGSYFNQKAERDVDHTFLTSIVDQSGTLRVQYMGWRFDPEEFLGDIKSVVREGKQS